MLTAAFLTNAMLEEYYSERQVASMQAQDFQTAVHRIKVKRKRLAAW